MKVVRQQLHEIDEVRRKYNELGKEHIQLLDAFADLNIANKKVKVLLQVAKKEIKKLREEIVEDLDELIAWSNNYPKDSEIYIRLKRKREKWEAKEQ